MASSGGGVSGASGGGDPGASWLSLLRALLAQEEVLFGILLAGSATQAWWQLYGVSRSLKTLKSARESTIAELNGIPPPRGREPLVGGDSGASGGGNAGGSAGWRRWWFRRVSPETPEQRASGSGGGKTGGGGGVRGADVIGGAGDAAADSGSSSSSSGGLRWLLLGGRSKGDGSTTSNPAVESTKSAVGSSSKGQLPQGQPQGQRQGPSDASELADYTNPHELVLVRGSVRLSSPPPSSSAFSASSSPSVSGSQSAAERGSLVVGGGSRARLGSPLATFSVPCSPLVPMHGAKQPCAVVERSDVMLYSELHPLLGWVIKSDQVNLVRQSVPFSLTDTSHPSAPRVDISLVGASQPLPLDTVYSHMHKAEPSWGATAMHVLIGKRLPVGLRTDERVLPINQEVTAVGHVRRGSDGRPAIFASQRFPYFLFPETKAGMIQKLNQRWGALLGWGVLLSATAAGVIGLAVWRTYRRRQARRQQRQQVEQAELERWMQILSDRQQQTAGAGAGGATGEATGGRGQVVADGGLVLNSHSGAITASPSDLERSLESLIRGGDADEEVVGEEVQSGELCVVCLHRKRKAVFIPCGHRVCCLSCSRVVRVEQALCPICRGQVLAAFRVYDA
ncbi:hypothetical protein CLOM_g5406 [Closterium sp. NIES-68]|nr:hypothetical protein CLOM_g5406 [Closterium sp. NIES-68]